MRMQKHCCDFVNIVSLLKELGLFSALSAPLLPREKKNKHEDSTYFLWDGDPLYRELEESMTAVSRHCGPHTDAKLDSFP